MRKSIKYLLPVIIIIFLLSGYFYFYNSVRIPNSIATKKLAIKFPDKYEQYTTIKCNFVDLINPEYAFVAKRPERDYEIFFFKIKTRNLFSKEIHLNYTGGTDIKNTTFPELVEMVKEDCYQFQEDFDAENPETQIDWGYREADSPEPPKTDEELK